MSETNQERKKLLIHEAYRQQVLFNFSLKIKYLILQQLFEQQMQQQGVMGVRMPMSLFFKLFTFLRINHFLIPVGYHEQIFADILFGLIMVRYKKGS